MELMRLESADALVTTHVTAHATTLSPYFDQRSLFLKAKIAVYRRGKKSFPYCTQEKVENLSACVYYVHQKQYILIARYTVLPMIDLSKIVKM